MSARATLLWLGEKPLPPNVREAAAGRWELQACGDGPRAAAGLRDAAVALTSLDGQANDPSSLERLVDAVDRSPAVAVVLLPGDAHVAWAVLSRRESKFLCIRQDAAPAELVAKVEAARALQPVIRNLEDELAAARKFGRPGSGPKEDLDEEMRLAARLQRDFLPRRLPEVGPVRFGVLYRPLGWVSGDIYDIARLDETHVGFYVADAVGHGVPAALLTMFVKRGLQTKRIAGNTYEIIPPEVSLAQLNAAICEQNLSSCQFCTAVYCVLNVADLTLTYARAGHPEPVLIHADGSLAALSCEGSLLGVFPDEAYRSLSVPLSPGDRLIMYTDGIEDALAGASGDRERFRRLLASLHGKPQDEMLLQLTAWIDEQPGGRTPGDDMTVVAVDISK